jgi:hypothetical protein
MKSKKSRKVAPPPTRGICEMAPKALIRRTKREERDQVFRLGLFCFPRPAPKREEMAFIIDIIRN